MEDRVLIKYNPSKILNKIAPKSKIKKLLTKQVTLKKTALDFISDVEFISKKDVSKVALNVVKSYKDRIKREVKEGAKASEIKSAIAADPKLLVQRVQNEVVLQISSAIKETYSGEFYIWLPSDANEADPEHQLNYGKKFQIGDGEMPGERIGCRCGMQILVPESKLQLSE